MVEGLEMLEAESILAPVKMHQGFAVGLLHVLGRKEIVQVVIVVGVAWLSILLIECYLGGNGVRDHGDIRLHLFINLVGLGPCSQNFIDRSNNLS